MAVYSAALVGSTSILPINRTGEAEPEMELGRKMTHRSEQAT